MVVVSSAYQGWYLVNMVQGEKHRIRHEYALFFDIIGKGPKNFEANFLDGASVLYGRDGVKLCPQLSI